MLMLNRSRQSKRERERERCERVCVFWRHVFPAPCVQERRATMAAVTDSRNERTESE